MRRLILVGLRVVVAALLLTAATAKAAGVSELEEVLRVSGLVPPQFLRQAAGALVAAEFVLGAGLLVPRLAGGAVRGALVLSCLFVAYSVWRGVNGIATPCSCFGPLFSMGLLASIGLELGMAAACVVVSCDPALRRRAARRPLPAGS